SSPRKPPNRFFSVARLLILFVLLASSACREQAPEQLTRGLSEDDVKQLIIQRLTNPKPMSLPSNNSAEIERYLRSAKTLDDLRDSTPITEGNKVFIGRWVWDKRLGKASIVIIINGELYQVHGEIRATEPGRRSFEIVSVSHGK